MWIGVQDTPAAVGATFGTNSGLITCGTTKLTVTPAVAQKYLKAELVAPTGTVAGTAACAKGKISLLVREYTSTNSAAAVKKKTNCFVCKDNSACDGASTT
jgi:hypothetical protein